ncbi:hypothetical protein MNEG_7732 [Monoraphidium neglectum]|uniref:Uncharacterized protein n=1 Tax=Monoraphidium neglectum TaxID=145388 RepID=A0A0D2KYD0_9CHLO|nr:hypothetical protein MNEG_7732 [Monoraphidium neglectum]KIZ00229.1 hypothetical protein MNEG_7732 [Monoraphidium neglectum]|eukprot:XP_013899248.1 hypothetical protein MNEG_7732 [Monoraphidium neglectum]
MPRGAAQTSKPTSAAPAAAPAAPQRLFTQPAPGTFVPYEPPASPPAAYAAPDLYYFDGANYRPWQQQLTLPPVPPAPAAQPATSSRGPPPPGAPGGPPLYEETSQGMFSRWAPPAGAAVGSQPNVTLYLRNETTGVFQVLFDPALAVAAHNSNSTGAPSNAAEDAADRSGGAPAAPGGNATSSNGSEATAWNPLYVRDAASSAERGQEAFKE